MNEIREPRPEETRLVPFEESLKLSQELLNKYGAEIGASENEQNSRITPFMSEVPRDIKEHYWGHGINRDGLETDLSAVLNILANKTMRGTIAKLAGSEPENAWTSGLFLIISPFDQPMVMRDGENNDIRNDMGVRINIGALVLAPTVYSLLPELKRMFPDIDIVPAAELKEYLSKPMQEPLPS